VKQQRRGLPSPRIPGRFKSSLDRDFFKRVWSTSPSIYEKRLRMIGFQGLPSVIDAGCGFGQWTTALARLNGEVLAVDVSPLRVETTRKIARSLGLRNITCLTGQLEGTLLPPSVAAGIFCYGVLFATDWKKCLRAFHRALRSGGRVYLNAAGLGWFLHLWKNEPNKTDDYDPRALAADVFRNTLAYRLKGKAPPPGGQVLIEREELVKESARLGFAVVGSGAEGTLNLDPTLSDPPEPFFRGTYESHEGCYEVLLEKR